MRARLQQGPNKGKERTGSAAIKQAKMERKWSRWAVGVDGSKVEGTSAQVVTGLKHDRGWQDQRLA